MQGGNKEWDCAKRMLRSKVIVGYKIYLKSICV